MGHCQYPEELAGTHFSVVDEAIMECYAPEIIDHSEKAIMSNKGEEEAIWIRVTGMPAPETVLLDNLPLYLKALKRP